VKKSCQPSQFELFLSENFHFMERSHFGLIQLWSKIKTIENKVNNGKYTNTHVNNLQSFGLK
jgi:hypothetical protein